MPQEGVKVPGSGIPSVIGVLSVIMAISLMIALASPVYQVDIPIAPDVTEAFTIGFFKTKQCKNTFDITTNKTNSACKTQDTSDVKSLLKGSSCDKFFSMGKSGGSLAVAVIVVLILATVSAVIQRWFEEKNPTLSGKFMYSSVALSILGFILLTAALGMVADAPNRKCESLTSSDSVTLREYANFHYDAALTAIVCAFLMGTITGTIAIAHFISEKQSGGSGHEYLAV